MGFFDSVGASLGGTLNRGSAAAQRAARIVKLRNDMAAHKRDRDTAIYQIGEIVYPLLSTYPDLADFCRGPMNAVAKADARLSELDRELQSIDEEARAEAEAAEAARALKREQAARKASEVVVTCPDCGTVIKEGDRFCMGCGKFAEEIREIRRAEAAKAAGSRCPKCGASISESDVFCMSCGEKIAKPKEASSDDDAASKEDVQTEATGGGRQDVGAPSAEADEPMGEEAPAEVVDPDSSAPSMDEAAGSRYCPFCGELLSTGGHFCPSCGSKVNAE